MNSSESVLSIFMKLILISRVAEKAAGELWSVLRFWLIIF